MGGEIGVSSAAGSGSEFWFTARLGKQAAGTPRESLPLADLRGVHVLVVDGSLASRTVLLAQLTNWGLRAEAVADGPTALQTLARARQAGDPFRAALLDVKVPGLDGATLAQAIQADAALRATRLVLLTPLGQRYDIRRMEESGFAAYVTKPVRPAELCAGLSAVLTDLAEAPPARSFSRHARIRELRRGGARILLAEDNITSQQVALAMLKKLGLRADAVANGAEALQALHALPYDLVVMDVQMPELDGLQVTRKVRQSSSLNSRIPIIAMTAHAMKGDRECCLAVGMNDYLTKPIDLQALAQALDKWLPLETAAARVPAPAAPAATAEVPADTPESPSATPPGAGAG